MLIYRRSKHSLVIFFVFDDIKLCEFMLFGLIGCKKFELEKSLIFEILNSNLQYTNQNFSIDFNRQFFALYRIKLFRPLLNVVLTKIKNNELRFKLLPMSSWDRLAGHCQIVSNAQLEIESVFAKKNYTIVIKDIKAPIIIHEISHAVEHILNLDLNVDFRKILASDTNGKMSANANLNSAIKQILKDDLKNYELKDVMSELFARFFEIIAMSYEVDGWSAYQFKYNDVERFFKNTINWFNLEVVPLLNRCIDNDVFKNSSEYVKSLKNYEKVWTEKINSKKIKLTSDSFLDAKETEEAIQSFEKWSKDKAVYKLDDGTEYYLFNDKNNFLLENKNKN